MRRRPILLACLAAIVVTAAAVAGSAEHERWLRTHPVLPALVGKTVTQVAEMMVPLHFGILVTGVVEDPNEPPGIVLAQNPPAGRRLAQGFVIDLRISQGSGIVPPLRGRRAAQAARQLEIVGLRLGSVRGIEDGALPGTVLEQFTPPGHQLRPNSAVDILVSNGLRGRPEQAAEPAPPARPPRGTAHGSKRPPPAGSAGDESPPVTPSASPERSEGGTRVESVAADCAGDAERQRDEVCHQPADDGGTQPDIHGPEHHRVPAGP